MRTLICRFVPAFAVLMVAAQANASFVFNVSSPSAPVTYSSPSGNTSFVLSPNSPQTFQGSSNVNVFNVSASSTATQANPDAYSFNFSETFTLTNSDGRVGTFVFTGTLTVTQAYQGAILSSVSNTNISSSSTGGFGVTFQGYAAPSPGSSGTSGAQGNLSLQVIAPSAVPEPASVLMLGLGLVGTAGFAARRRFAQG